MIEKMTGIAKNSGLTIETGIETGIETETEIEIEIEIETETETEIETGKLTKPCLTLVLQLF